MSEHAHAPVQCNLFLLHMQRLSLHLLPPPLQLQDFICSLFDGRDSVVSSTSFSSFSAKYQPFDDGEVETDLALDTGSRYRLDNRISLNVAAGHLCRG